MIRSAPCMCASVPACHAPSTRPMGSSRHIWTCVTVQLQLHHSSILRPLCSTVTSHTHDVWSVNDHPPRITQYTSTALPVPCSAAALPTAARMPARMITCPALVEGTAHHPSALLAVAWTRTAAPVHSPARRAAASVASALPVASRASHAAQVSWPCLSLHCPSALIKQVSLTGPGTRCL